jgi:hypothetical protein
MKPLLMTHDDVQVPSSYQIDLGTNTAATNLSPTPSQPTRQRRRRPTTTGAQNQDGTPHVAPPPRPSSTDTHSANAEEAEEADDTVAGRADNHPPTLAVAASTRTTTQPAGVGSQEGSVYLNIAKVLLVLVVVIALLYVVYWVVHNVYKIDLVETVAEYVGLQPPTTGNVVGGNAPPPPPPDSMRSSSSTQVMPEPEPLHYYSNDNTTAPHADGAYQASAHGAQMKSTLSDKSVSALLDLMANVA